MPELHELVFTDRAARPAKWQTRCGRTDVPLEHTMTPTPTSYYQVTCRECLVEAAAPAIAAAEREACAAIPQQMADHPGADMVLGMDEVRCALREAAWKIRKRGESGSVRTPQDASGSVSKVDGPDNGAEALSVDPGGAEGAT